MAVGERDGGDVAVHLDQLRLQPFAAKETFFDGDFDRKPGHADGRVGERDFAGVGGDGEIGCALEVSEQCQCEKSFHNFVSTALYCQNVFTTKARRTRRLLGTFITCS